MTSTPATAAPACTLDDARRLLREVWGVEGELRELAAERDRNFRLDREGKPFGVLKIVHPDEERDALAMQAALLAHVERVAPRLGTPRVIPTRDGRTRTGTGDGGVPYAARLVSWLPGTPLGDRERTPDLLRAIGATMGQLSAVLRGFGHPGAHRSLPWDIRRAADARDRLSHVRPEGRALIERALQHFEGARPRLDDLRHGVVHGDLNDWNVLVDDNGGVSGIIDVGDAAFAPVIADLAIAATYMAMGSRSPLETITTLVRAYATAFPVDEDEADVLIDLIRGRLCTSLSISAMRHAETSEDGAYWFVSERGGWELLAWLDAANDAHVRAALRQACGWPGTRAAAAFARWKGRSQNVHPPLRQRLDRLKLHRLSWESPDDPMVRATAAADLEGADRAYDELQRREGFDVGVGTWGERRAVYAADAFRSRLLDAARRDTHLGLDLFAPAGTELVAPLDGVVVSATVCDLPQDFGGVVLLEHQPEAGVRFCSLWGHLDPSSIANLARGDVIRTGSPFAKLGDSAVNGGWVPHLHLQLVLTGETDAAGIIGVGESALIELWRELYPDPGEFAGLPPEVMANEDTIAARQARATHFATNLKLSYARPLHIVRGRDVWLYDVRGRAFLDCYNNVAHVGHCHPRVVEAIASQASQLNTNTRYVHRLIGDLAQRLLATFPAPLDTVYFTNSGSEATELALRIARTATGRPDTIVLDWAYHGNTQAAIDCSPYKYKRAGGQGRRDYIHEVACPDPYRAPRDWAEHEVGRRYAAEIIHLIASGVKPAALLAETIPSCAGQVVVPRPFFENAFAAVRRAGGVCILDEVQVGFGRVGGAMWAFEEHGVVPDIVTLGKPMGNGHPIGAVVTSRPLAAAFSNGMEYFNTFGGNPVSAAAALSVLDVLRSEQLLERASTTGKALLRGLEGLQRLDERIGQVRGRGLFLGFELVSDLETREPATAVARRVVQSCLESGILAGTDGPHDNVIKLRPPMTFGTEHVELLLSAVERALKDSR